MYFFPEIPINNDGKAKCPRKPNDKIVTNGTPWKRVVRIEEDGDKLRRERERGSGSERSVKRRTSGGEEIMED